MTENLQSLLEKINREGVEKAEAEAAKIIAAAKTEAAAIRARAIEDAAATENNAKKNAADYIARANESIAQVARDAIFKVESALTSTLDILLKQNVEKALDNPQATAALVMDAIKQITTDAELVAGPKLAATLKAELAAKPNISVIIDEALEVGFTIKLDGGRIEHDFTASAIANELAKRLRPELAKLLK